VHPAASVIFFTVASGAGYGVLALTGLLVASGRMPEHPLFGVINLGIGLVLVTAGLLSSTAHLGHPERAWRAITQWRSSWLSREGVFALLTYLPALALAWMWLFGEGANESLWAVSAWSLCGLSLLTLFSTAMIYRSLKPIPAWNNGWTLPAYLALGLASGAVVLAATMAALGMPLVELGLAALAFIAAGAAIKTSYWRALARGFHAPGRAEATGLADGAVLPFENPHSADNYLMKEMGYRIARKHADKLRRYAMLLGFLVPFVAVAASLAVANAGFIAIIAGLGAISMLVGLLVERWLFFAEARHLVTLYYRDPDAGA